MRKGGEGWEGRSVAPGPANLTSAGHHGPEPKACPPPALRRATRHARGSADTATWRHDFSRENLPPNQNRGPAKP